MPGAAAPIQNIRTRGSLPVQRSPVDLQMRSVFLLALVLHPPSRCAAAGWFGGDDVKLVAETAQVDCSATSDCIVPGEGAGEFDPYSIIGVPVDASDETIVKAYRKLARRWHPDRNRGSEEVFATIAQAYGVLTDTEKREIYDRLGARGLERLRDGDPSVKKDWLPPDEVLRRIHNDGDEPWHRELPVRTCRLFQAIDARRVWVLLAEWLVTSTFASFSRLVVPARDHLRWLPILLGIDTEFPWVGITATDAAGQAVASGSKTRDSVTFKIQLSGKSINFVEADVNHNCPEGSRFLGMKATYYLECVHSQVSNVDQRRTSRHSDSRMQTLELISNWTIVQRRVALGSEYRR